MIRALLKILHWTTGSLVTKDQCPICFYRARLLNAVDLQLQRFQEETDYLNLFQSSCRSGLGTETSLVALMALIGALTGGYYVSIALTRKTEEKMYTILHDPAFKVISKNTNSRIERTLINY